MTISGVKPAGGGNRVGRLIFLEDVYYMYLLFKHFGAAQLTLAAQPYHLSEKVALARPPRPATQPRTLGARATLGRPFHSGFYSGVWYSFRCASLSAWQRSHCFKLKS